VSRCFSTTSFILDHKLRNAPIARTISALNQLLLLFADDIVVWNSSSICNICLPEVANGSVSEDWPMYLVLTLLFGEMLDVARNGPHGGKMGLLWQGW
jgi:hypothetical protein